MDGVKLAALFSYTPNKLKYCGPDSASNTIYDYIVNKKNKDIVKNLLIKFEALHPYLKIISEKNNLEFFDYKVIEAYWIGNKLADLNKQAAINLINMLNKRGLLTSIAKNLINKIKGLSREEIPLTHLFNVIFIGVGAVTGSVPTIIENMDKCRISWGTVCEIHDSYLLVEYHRLRNQDNKYFINKDTEKIKINYDKNFCRLNKEDIVAIHWNMAVKKLDFKESKNLKNYTQKITELTSMR